MKLANCAFATALAFAMASGSAVAEEQVETAKNVSQPTVMSDAELDQIVGGQNVQTMLVNMWSDHDVWDKSDKLLDVILRVPNGE